MSGIGAWYRQFKNEYEYFNEVSAPIPILVSVHPYLKWNDSDDETEERRGLERRGGEKGRRDSQHRDPGSGSRSEAPGYEHP